VSSVSLRELLLYKGKSLGRLLVMILLPAAMSLGIGWLLSPWTAKSERLLEVSMRMPSLTSADLMYPAYLKSLQALPSHMNSPEFLDALREKLVREGFLRSAFRPERFEVTLISDSQLLLIRYSDRNAGLVKAVLSASVDLSIERFPDPKYRMKPISQAMILWKRDTQWSIPIGTTLGAVLGVWVWTRLRVSRA
jgi:hypothetical protein